MLNNWDMYKVELYLCEVNIAEKVHNKKKLTLTLLYLKPAFAKIISSTPEFLY